MYGHRSNPSASSLQPPPGGNQPYRRMTSPSQTSLNLTSSRPSSPLRNAFTYDTSTGIDPNDQSFGSDDEDHPNRWRRSPSPASSVSNLAASFVQRVGNFVGGMAPRSPNMMPSDAELEAEAERERERSRREAEAILTREAQQRQPFEQRVAAIVGNTKGLPPPPARAQTMPSPTPSPSGSQKEGNWWQSAKNKFTSGKEKDPPTPAQQVMLDAKARDKSKGKEPEDDPFSASNLNLPIQPPHRKPVPASPSSPTPSRPNTSVPNLSPSPMRTSDSLMSNSPSREAPPTYAQFTSQGTLDVPATLLAIAKRFEKLEKWTIGHVRALEDRMNDVERWLVDKEKEKDKPGDGNGDASKSSGVDSSAFKDEMNDIRDEISELQGRVGELGREMAKMATAPSNLSSGPKTQTVAATPVSMVTRQASTSVIPEDGPPVLPPILPDFTGNTPRHSRLSSTALDTTSPPLASSAKSSGTKLPYPTGDYNAPAEAFSPPNSPPASLNGAFRRRSSGSGLPTSSSIIGAPTGRASPISSSPRQGRSPNLSKTTENTSTPTSGSNGSGLPPPKPATNFRQGSVSPTPRKRYTVALGGPIVAPPELQSNAAEAPAPRRLPATPKSSAKQLATDDEDEEDEEPYGGETIGKSAAVKLTRSLATKRSTTSLSSVNSVGSLSSLSSAKDEPASGSWSRGRGDYKAPESPSPAPVMSNRRMKAQSVYGMSSFQPTAEPPTSSSPGTTAPLRLRAKSSERLGGSSSTSDLKAGITTATGGKFVDPLLLRRQEAATSAKTPKPAGKVPIGQLVAFFDKDKKNKH